MNGMSALLRLADISRTSRDFRFVPISDMGPICDLVELGATMPKATLSKSPLSI